MTAQVLSSHGTREEFQLLHQGIIEAQAMGELRIWLVMDSDSYLNQVQGSKMHFQAPEFSGSPPYILHSDVDLFLCNLLALCCIFPISNQLLRHTPSLLIYG